MAAPCGILGLDAERALVVVAGSVTDLLLLLFVLLLLLQVMVVVVVDPGPQHFLLALLASTSVRVRSGKRPAWPCIAPPVPSTWLPSRLRSACVAKLVWTRYICVYKNQPIKIGSRSAE